MSLKTTITCIAVVGALACAAVALSGYSLDVKVKAPQRNCEVMADDLYATDHKILALIKAQSREMLARIDAAHAAGRDMASITDLWTKKTDVSHALTANHGRQDALLKEIAASTCKLPYSLASGWAVAGSLPETNIDRDR